MDLQTFMRDLVQDGTFEDLAINEYAQFGLGPRQYMGASILPERTVPRNIFREGSIRYRTVIANDGTRYSPAQKKGGGEIGGTFLVEVGHSDIAREFTADMYDALLELLDINQTMDAAANLIGWSNTALNLALVEHVERQRWQAFIDGSVVRVGDNGYEETVVYPNPAGHRAAAGGDWTTAYNPWDDITTMRDLITNKGYTINRIVTSTAVLTTLRANIHTARQAGRVMNIPDGAGGMTEYPLPVSDADLNRVFESYRLPAPETYDLEFFTQTGSGRFMPEDTMSFFSTTGRTEQVNNTVTGEFRILQDTLGYSALGRAVGQRTPGRVINIEGYSNKPPRIEGEAWQASLPVITEPEALGTITSITLP